ncbi:MAG: phosphate signaling complex protein PhoU [Chloroflexota bacterium]|nr:phosphate signaling complex protein PhoU [Chloroflexota bacterium]
MAVGHANMTRQRYANQIQDLRDAIVSMASMVDKAIARATDSLRQQDLNLARQVIADDRKINEFRWQTEGEALLIIATQAPMAGDLRLVSAAIHITTDLERMADHAAGIAKIVIETADEPLLKPLVDLPRMSDLARTMLADSITAYVEGDEPMARQIARRDDEIDALYDQIYRELLTFMLADPTTINRATHLLWVAHNLERIGDRVTNICEQIVFTATGSLEEL